MVGDFLYVSGQGARDRDGRLPDTVDAQVRQTLENVKTVVEAAGLTLEHVVYSQVYLAACRDHDTMDRSGANISKQPARAVLGVTGCPPTPRSRSMPSRLRSLRRKSVVLPDIRRIRRRCGRDGGDRSICPVVWRRHQERPCARGSGRAGATRAGQHETDVDGGAWISTMVFVNPT
jgi:2-iminobutanoate/2-iminopropanoate deaminase